MSTSERYVNGEYQQHNNSWHESDADYKAEKVVDLLTATGRLASIKSICDVGCGTGGVLDELATRLAPDVRLAGYEPSPQAIALSQQFRRGQRVEIVQGNSQDVPSGWDLLMALDVLEHVEDYFGFLRCLKGKSALYMFNIPLDMSALNLARSGKLMRLRREIGHLHYFSWDTALSTLEEAGYVVDSVAPNQIAVDRAQSMAARTARPVRMIGNRLSPRLASRIFGGTSLLVLASAVR